MCLFQEDDFDLTDFENYDNDSGDIFANVSASGLSVYPAACRVVYGYQVTQIIQFVGEEAVWQMAGVSDRLQIKKNP